LGTLTVNPAPLALDALQIDAAQPYRWRLDGGFWSQPQTGPWAPRPMLDGNHRIEFSQAGRTVAARFLLDSAPPAVRFAQSGATLTISASDVSPVRLRVNGGDWQDRSELTMRLKPGRHAIQVSARDASGNEREASTTVVVKN